MIKDITLAGTRYFTLHLSNGDEVMLAVIDKGGQIDGLAERERVARDLAVGVIKCLQASYSEMGRRLKGEVKDE